VSSAPHAPTCPQSIPYEVGSGAPYGCTCRGREPTARWVERPVPGHYIGPFATQEEAEAYMERASGQGEPEEQCPVQSFGGLRCGRSRGHDGPHVVRALEGEQP
jgi:hypothetical protein